MKKLAVLCIAALGAALLVFGTAPAASAYPEVTCNVTVAPLAVHPGESFTATGEIKTTNARTSASRSSADAVTWTFKWNGVTKHRTGNLVHASFTAPEVSSTRKVTLTAQANTAAGPCVHHIKVKVIGPAVAGPSGGGGLLPSTGGPSFWLLVAALVLLLGGGTVLVARRRS
jgi:LPXTG-motif cell wall-anchored protein